MSEQHSVTRIRQVVGKTVRAVFERLTGWRIYTNLSRGVDLYSDIQAYLPTLDVRVVFDVGANVGQSTREYVDSFPVATIYTFEPVAQTFAKLETSILQRHRVHCFQLALGEENGEKEIVLAGPSDAFRLREHYTGPSDGQQVETVRIETVDRFCDHHSIARINLLKIDTEGHDLMVLQGSERMLREHNIDLIQAEVGMNPSNNLHVPFETVKTFMEKRGYYLFSLYDQVGEYALNGTVLRRANALFMSSRRDFA